MPNTAAVVDTNVLISALLRSTSALAVINLIANKTLTPIISEDLLREFSKTIVKPKFLNAFDPFKLTFLHRLIKERAVFVKSRASLLVCRDAKDNLLLECAVDGSADFIITGDKDLLVLNPFRGIEILTPSAFIKRIKK